MASHVAVGFGWLLLVAAPFLAAAACADTGPASLPAVEVLDSSGVEVVINRRSDWGPGEGWQVSEQPILEIGEVEGPNLPEQFSSIYAVRRLSDGRIVVLEGGLGELRYFGPGGEHLATVGGKGEGPGEFGLAWKLFEWPGDTVIVEDYWRDKHVFFGPEPRFVREEVLDRSRRGALGSLVGCHNFTLPDRSRLACLEEPGESTAGSGRDPGHLRAFSRLVRVAWDYSSIDTLGLYGGIEQWGLATSQGTSFFVHPFYSSTAIAASTSPMRIAVAVNPEYSIEVWDPDGRLERIVRRETPRRMPSQEELDWAEGQLLTWAREDEALANRARVEIVVPDSVPSINRMLFANSGELLVARSLLRGSSGQKFEYDIFDPRGRWLGTVAFPDGFVVQEVGEDFILGVWRDEFQVPYVRMYALDRGRRD